jgi:hypothetical protein
VNKLWLHPLERLLRVRCVVVHAWVRRRTTMQHIHVFVLQGTSIIKHIGCLGCGLSIGMVEEGLLGGLKGRILFAHGRGTDLEMRLVEL